MSEKRLERRLADLSLMEKKGRVCCHVVMTWCELYKRWLWLRFVCHQVLVDALQRVARLPGHLLSLSKGTHTISILWCCSLAAWCGKSWISNSLPASPFFYLNKVTFFLYSLFVLMKKRDTFLFEKKHFENTFLNFRVWRSWRRNFSSTLLSDSLNFSWPLKMFDLSTLLTGNAFLLKNSSYRKGFFVNE